MKKFRVRSLVAPGLAIFLAFPVLAALSSSASAEFLCEALFARIDANATLKICNRDINSGKLKGEDLAYAYYSRGDVYLKIGVPATYADWLDTAIGNDAELDKALSDYSRAIEIAPNGNAAASAYNNRGLIYYYRKKYDLALSDAGRAIELGKKRETVLYPAFALMGDAHEKMGDLESALKDYTQASEDILKTNVRAVDVLTYRCRLIALLNRRADELLEGLENCNQAIELSKSLFVEFPLHVRGLVYLRMKAYDKAIADLDESASKTVRPKGNAFYARTLHLRGVAKLRKGDAIGGEADIEAARRLGLDAAKEYARYDLAR